MEIFKIIAMERPAGYPVIRERTIWPELGEGGGSGNGVDPNEIRHLRTGGNKLLPREPGGRLKQGNATDEPEKKSDFPARLWNTS